MCFSARVNFTIGAVNGIIGLATLLKTKGSRYILIAATPAIFAVQQFFEGIVWLHMDPNFTSTPFSQFSLSAYLFFALLFWPLWIPISMIITEKVYWRKTVMYGALIIGVMVVFIDLIYLYQYPPVPVIEGHNLNYGEAVDPVRYLYGISIILPLFVSGIPNMWLMGILIMLSFLFSHLIYYVSFTSVWCFFAAALSIVLYIILPKTNQRYP